MNGVWEKVKGNTTHYVHIDRNSVTIGSHQGSGHTDNAKMMSYEEFKSGEWDEWITRNLGKNVLNEIYNKLLHNND